MSRILRYTRPLPTLLPGCDSLESWHVIEQNSITLRTATKAAGTSPPTCTLSGSLIQLRDIRIECTTGGDEVAARVRYSVDGGANWTTNQAINTPLALGSTGITATFAAGTYNTNNVWRSCIDGWANSAPGTHRFSTSSTGTSPKINLTGGNNGRSCAETDSANQEQLIMPYAGGGEVDAIATTLGGGTDKAFTVFCVAKILGAAGTEEAIWSLANATTLNELVGNRAGVSSSWNVSKRDTAATAVSQSGGTKDNNWHVFEFFTNSAGTQASLLVDGAAEINAVAFDVGATALTVLQIAVYPGGVFSSMLVADFITYRGSLDAVTRGAIRQHLKNRHGIA